MPEQGFVKAACYLNGRPVYHWELTNDCTAKCPQCKGQRESRQIPAISVIPNVIGHMGCRHGCGIDKLLFDMSGYVQFGDLPPIRIGHYKDFLPYKNMQETVSYGIAKILGKELRRTEHLLQKETEKRIKDKQAALQYLHNEKKLSAGQVCNYMFGAKVCGVFVS